jgi:DNA-binding transcriptional ArsR family regulator
MPEDRVALVEEPEALQALAHPVRVAILEALRAPASAAGVARAVGRPRQNVNYHLKELERAGLVRRVGTRRNGNFIETLFESVAGTFLVSPRAAWGGDPRRIQAMADQHSLENLVLLGERLQQDATALLDRAAFDGEEISSAAVSAEIRFESEQDRAAFLKEYLKKLGPLIEKYGRKDGVPYRVALAVYPQTTSNVEEGA